MMDNLHRWIWMVIISINLTTRAMNVTRAMINTTVTIVMVQKEEMKLKFWMRYYLPLFLSEYKADDVIPYLCPLCQKVSGKFEFKSSTTRTSFLNDYT